jgi:uncharacterized protein (TIGR02246 family)
MADPSRNPIGASDEQAIRALLHGYVAVWNRHEMTGLADLFTDDAEWINIVGMHWRGRAAVVKAHDVFHRTMFRKTDLMIDSFQIRAISEDVAAAVMVVKVGGFTPPDGVHRPPARDRLSLILAKRKGVWRIVLGHNTVIDERAEPFDPVTSGWIGETRT